MRLAPSIRALVAAALLLAAPAAQAVSPDVVISQVYGGGGNSGATYTNDFIELHNRGTAIVNLTGWSVQYASSTGTSWQVTTLSGSIQPGAYYLVQEAQGAGGTTPLPTPDATGSIAMSSSAGKVALVNGTATLSGSCPTVYDFVGYGSATNCSETSPAPTLSNTTANFRASSGCADTDNNSTDFSTGAPAPRNSASTFVACAEAAPTVASTTPVNLATGVSVGTNITINFSEVVNVSASGVTVECPVGTTITFTGLAASSTASVVLNPTANLPPSTTCRVTVVASQVNDVDSSDPPDTMASNYVFDFTTGTDPCTGFTTIPAIQGTTDTTPLAGQLVTTRGIVVGDYEQPAGSPQLRGFFLQAATGDGNAATSDGVFVYTGDGVDRVAVGDDVAVTGTVNEYQNQTQIAGSVAITGCGSGTGTVTPVNLTLPVPAPVGGVDYLERFEGMLVRLPQTLTVTENYYLGRFGEVLVSNSDSRLFQPTHVAAPGAPALAVAAANALDELIVDDADNSQNVDPVVFGRLGNPLSAGNTLRGGDTVSDVTGVLRYGWAGNSASPNAWRLMPLGSLGGSSPDFQPSNPRPTTPADVGGTLKVASMNVLNYFNTFGSGACTLGVGGAAVDCRGADNATEFTRQADKIVAAMSAIDADVFALSELENDGYGGSSAINDLVSRLNAVAGAGTYAFVDVDAATSTTNALGVDAIKVGLIYKPASVTPVGQTATLRTGAFGLLGPSSYQLNRPPLAQAFQQGSADARFVVAVNHFKSKGSDCDALSDPDAGDGQGNCNLTRTAAALDLVTWLATDPTGTGDPDVLIVGDLNSYRMEDPVATIETAGYLDLVDAAIGDGAYSYVFDGQAGYLDHALATPSLNVQITGVTEWHINADEPSVLDYNTNFKSVGQQASLYAADAYRAADHDPVVVGLDLGAVRTVEGTTGTGTGTATATITGGGVNCTFLSSAWIDAATLSPAPPAGVSFPHGLLDFTLSGCVGPVTVEIEFPGSSGTLSPWKFGATQSNPAAHWYGIPGASIVGSTLTFTVEDGGQGDGDLVVNNLIDDPAGIAFGAQGAAIPALGGVGLALLLGLLAAAGALALRH